MDIYDAIKKIGKLLEAYRGEHGDAPAPWAPTEVKILPSGDENDTIKIWFNFGPDVQEEHVQPLLDQFEEAVIRDLPEVGSFSLHLRGDAF
jgi:hypothetical protein